MSAQAIINRVTEVLGYPPLERLLTGEERRGVDIPVSNPWTVEQHLKRMRATVRGDLDPARWTAKVDPTGDYVRVDVAVAP